MAAGAQGDGPVTKLSTAEDPGCPGRQWGGHGTGGKGQGGTQGAQSYSHEPGRLGTPRQEQGEKWKRPGAGDVGVQWDGLDRQDGGVGSLLNPHVGSGPTRGRCSPHLVGGDGQTDGWEDEGCSAHLGGFSLWHRAADGGLLHLPGKGCPAPAAPKACAPLSVGRCPSRF